jgi:hypothetical protein
MSRHVSVHECELLQLKGTTGLDLSKAVIQSFRKVQLCEGNFRHADIPGHVVTRGC